MAKDFFDELSDTITRTTKDLSKKAGQIYETQKIRSKISSEEQMIQKLKADIGNVIYEKYKDGAEIEDGLKGFCEEIQQHLHIIAGYKDAAAELKGQKICPACGKSVDRSVAFCPFCGSPCPTREPEKAEGEVVDSETEEAAENEETAAEASDGDAAENPEAAEAENAEITEETADEAEEVQADAVKASETCEETEPVSGQPEE